MNGVPGNRLHRRESYESPGLHTKFSATRIDQKRNFTRPVCKSEFWEQLLTRMGPCPGLIRRRAGGLEAQETLGQLAAWPLTRSGSRPAREPAAEAFFVGRMQTEQAVELSSGLVRLGEAKVGFDQK